jgi:hypothetical protein
MGHFRVEVYHRKRLHSALPTARWHFRAPPRGSAAWEFPSSTTRDVRATRSCLLYAGRTGDSTGRKPNPAGPPSSLLGQVGQPLSPVVTDDTYAGSSASA